MSLRSVDERWPPVAAARVRQWADALEQLTGRARLAAERLRPVVLDERLAGRGVLHRLRDRPQVGLVVSGALLVAGVGVAAVRDRAQPQPVSASRTTDTGPSYDVSSQLLGPSVGTLTSAYEERVSRGLFDAARTAPNKPRVALISFRQYDTPAQAVELLAGFSVARAFLRAPAAGRVATPRDVEVKTDLLSALRAAYAQTARQASAALRSYTSVVKALRGTTKQDQSFRDLYDVFARASAAEASAYAHSCACVYSAVVVATPRQLLTLRARPEVRAVEVAPVGLTVGQIEVQPLQPDTIGLVSRPTIGVHRP